MPHSDLIIDGKVVPSVTTILGVVGKPFLMRWYGKYGNRLCMRKLKISGDIGTQFHSLVDLIVNGVPVTPPTRRLTGMCNSFRGWLTQNPFTPEVQEFKVLSKLFWYQGTLDAIGRFPGTTDLVILDWKSGAGIYPEMLMQVSAYAMAYEEQTGIHISRGILLDVTKTKPNHQIHECRFDLTSNLFKGFLGALDLYNTLKATETFLKPPKKVKK